MSKFIVFVLLSVTLLVAQANELLSVVVVFRHGDRAPVSFYTNDPYNISNFPVDYGQLTTLGKQQHYSLGQWFRERYDGFLPAKYDNNDIYIRTSDVDRTHMSAQSNLAGLYPPVGDQVWNEDLLWQPIPVHTVPYLEDDLLAQEKSCAKYDSLLAEVENSEFIQNLTSDNQELYEYLTNHTGDTISSLYQVWGLFDTLFIEDRYDLTLPAWTSQVYPEPLSSLTNFVLSLSTYTPELARLKSGRVLYDILDRFDSTLNGTSTYKFIMYSAHDSTLANILNAIGAYDGDQPSYANTVIFELRKNISGEYVNILYKRPDRLVKISLDGCTFNCGLTELKSILSPLVISESEFETECAEE